MVRIWLAHVFVLALCVQLSSQDIIPKYSLFIEASVQKADKRFFEFTPQIARQLLSEQANVIYSVNQFNLGVNRRLFFVKNFHLNAGVYVGRYEDTFKRPFTATFINESSNSVPLILVLSERYQRFVVGVNVDFSYHVSNTGLSLVTQIRPEFDFSKNVKYTVFDEVFGKKEFEFTSINALVGLRYTLKGVFIQMGVRVYNYQLFDLNKYRVLLRTIPSMRYEQRNLLRLSAAIGYGF